jgi:hypothetical protein
MPNIKKWTYFNETEVEGLDIELVSMADIARHKAGIPFVLTSTVRTPEQNNAVGGVQDSAHTKGLAFDLRCKNSMDCFKIVDGLIFAGFKRIIIGVKIADGKLTFHNVHADVDNTKPTPCLSIKLYE